MTVMLGYNSLIWISHVQVCQTGCVTVLAQLSESYGPIRALRFAVNWVLKIILEVTCLDVSASKRKLINTNAVVNWCHMILLKYMWTFTKQPPFSQFRLGLLTYSYYLHVSKICYSKPWQVITVYINELSSGDEILCETSLQQE